MDFSRTFLERKSVRAYEGRPVPVDLKARCWEQLSGLPLSAPIVIHKDRYALPSAKALASLYAGEGFGAFTPTAAAENPGQALYARKFSAHSSVEMRQSVTSMLEDWR